MMESLSSSEQKPQVGQLNKLDNAVHQHEVTAITPFEVSEEVDSHKPRQSRPRNLLPKLAIGAFLGASAIAASVYGYRWYQYNRFHISSDNAYTSADIYPVSSRVSGVVTQITVKDNDTVNPGSVLFKLDSRESQVALTRAKAGLDLAKQQAEAVRESGYNLPNVPQLVNPAPVGTKQGQLQPPAINSEPNNAQIEANRQQYKIAVAAIAQKEAEVKEAELKLSYANVIALVPGQVSNSNIRVGQPIQAGQTLVQIIQPNPWIVANFKEEQLERIQPGQKAEIKIAAFPSRKFIGKVESISSNSINRVTNPSPESTPGGSYSNAAFNNVGRIPVKIVFEPESVKDFESKIAPGMSANVTISTKTK